MKITTLKQILISVIIEVEMKCFERFKEGKGCICGDGAGDEIKRVLTKDSAFDVTLKDG